MALWKDNTAPAATKDAPISLAEPSLERKPEPLPDVVPPTTKRATASQPKESVIAADISISGKIDGAGHVRIAGQFEGDVNIKGDLSIEPGARLTGGIRAESVAIAGAVEGNIEQAKAVELLATGVLEGDLKAGTLTVAAGSRMRGHVEFGWGDEPAHESSRKGPRPVS